MAGAQPLALPDGLTPGKVIGVHLNYHSRAAQRGRVPTEPSYFLKPTTSLSGGGDVVRPRGTELLAFEAEIAVIIGAPGPQRRALRRPARYIGWYAPANDFGLHDFRWADRGSNVMAKGQDGFSPLGPAMAGQGVDPTTLRITTHRQRRGAPGRDRRRPHLHLRAAHRRPVAVHDARARRRDPHRHARGGERGGARATWSRSTLEGAGSVTSTIVEAGAELASLRGDAQGHRRGARLCHRRHARPRRGPRC